MFGSGRRRNRLSAPDRLGIALASAALVACGSDVPGTEPGKVETAASGGSQRHSPEPSATRDAGLQGSGGTAFGDSGAAIPTGGRTASAPGSGGGPTMSGGAGNGAAGPQTEPDPCTPMDARSHDSECSTVLGYAFTGTTCSPIRCRCEGGDCGALQPTMLHCRTQYGQCLRDAGDPCAPWVEDCPLGPIQFLWNGVSCEQRCCASFDCQPHAHASLEECKAAHRQCDQYAKHACLLDDTCLDDLELPRDPPPAGEGCRGPSQAGCSSCCEEQGAGCTLWESSRVSTYDVSTDVSECPTDCVPCARCRFQDEDRLRRMLTEGCTCELPGNSLACAMDPDSCPCLCLGYQGARARCPDVTVEP